MMLHDDTKNGCVGDYVTSLTSSGLGISRSNACDALNTNECSLLTQLSFNNSVLLTGCMQSLPNYHQNKGPQELKY